MISVELANKLSKVRDILKESGADETTIAKVCQAIKFKPCVHCSRGKDWLDFSRDCYECGGTGEDKDSR